MRTQFVSSTLNQLLARKILTLDSRIVAICAGDPERQLFAALKFKNVVITNLDEETGRIKTDLYETSLQDAMQLGYENDAFDFAFVSDGLHHCDSPHRALLEMYRVACKGVLVFESRDSLLMKAVVGLGLATEYEVGSVMYHGGVQGGVNHSEIPNYIYRWTEREFEKTINSYSPIGQHAFIYFYGLNLPWFWSRGKSRYLIAGVDMLLRLLTAPVRTQRNSFAMVAIKPQPSKLWPWLKYLDGRIRFHSPHTPAAAESQEP